MVKLRFLFFCAVLFLFFGCKAFKDMGKGKSNYQKEQDEAFIMGKRWVLQNKNGGVKANGSVIYMEIDKKLRVSGYSGCNRLISNAKFGRGDVLHFGPVATTLMLCASMREEDSFKEMLRKVNRYELSGKILHLYRDKLLLLRFKLE